MGVIGQIKTKTRQQSKCSKEHSIGWITPQFNPWSHCIASSQQHENSRQIQQEKEMIISNGITFENVE
jgi:hypothetical protein